MIKPEGIIEAVKIAIDKFANDGVKKSEIIINTRNIINGLLDIEKVVEILQATFKESKTEKDINCKIRLGVNRRNGPSALLQTSKMFQYLEDSGVFCGLDLNGEEHIYPTSEFIDSFKKMEKLNIPFTIHAGESLDQLESLEQAIALKPQRIGHAIAMINKTSLIKKITQKKICLEICPSSSLKTKTIKSLKNHPIFKLIEMNTPLVIATDNPGLFKTSLSREYSILQKNGASKELLTKTASLSLAL